jgi:hypothetical protein
MTTSPIRGQEFETLLYGSFESLIKDKHSFGDIYCVNACNLGIKSKGDPKETLFVNSFRKSLK